MTTTPSPYEMGAAVGQNITKGIRGGFEDLAINRILQQAQSGQNPQEVQNAMNQILTQISPEKRQGLALAMQGMQQQQQRQRQQDFYTSQGLDPRLASLPESIQKEYVANLKKDIKSEVNPEVQKRVKNAINRQFEIVKSGATGLPGLGWAKRFSSNIREAREEFNNLSGNIETALLPLVNKGVLSEKRFNYILSLLPRPSDTDATFRGKAKAFALMFDLDIPGLTETKNMQQNPMKEVKNVPSKETVDDFAEFWE